MTIRIRHSMEIKIHKLSMGGGHVLLILIMLLSDLFAQILPKLFSYGDEFFSLICATFLLANVIKTKK